MLLVKKVFYLNIFKIIENNINGFLEVTYQAEVFKLFYIADN